jgi:hypothetical protein
VPTSEQGDYDPTNERLLTYDNFADLLFER